jgi:hypothetical protein
MSDDLVKSMDEAALTLLRRINKEDSIEGENAPFSEQLKAFDAVAGWMETRSKIVPPERGESRISELRRKLDAKPSRKASGGGTPPAATSPAAY